MGYFSLEISYSETSPCFTSKFSVPKTVHFPPFSSKVLIEPTQVIAEYHFSMKAMVIFLFLIFKFSVLPG